MKVTGERQPDGAVLATRIVVRENQDLSIEAELRQSFDEIERIYREQGRMRFTGKDGKVLEDNGRLLESGPMVDRVRRITANLTPPPVNPGDLRVYVVENQEWNAMAAPNFSIYVYSGLLEDMDDDEVALVLGHELAHATHEHSRKQLRRNRWVGIGSLAAVVLAETVVDDKTTRRGVELATLGTALALTAGYSREHEDQADRVGMRYAHEGGYDVTKGPQLWGRFAEKYGESPVAVNFFFGDHSRSIKRAALLQAEIDHNYTLTRAGV